jgi:hypothetical protein
VARISLGSSDWSAGTQRRGTLILSGGLAPLVFCRKHRVDHHSENPKLESSVSCETITPVKFSREFCRTTKLTHHRIEKRQAPSLTGTFCEGFKTLGKFPVTSSVMLLGFTNTILYSPAGSACGDAFVRITPQASKMIEWPFISTVPARLHGRCCRRDLSHDRVLLREVLQCENFLTLSSDLRASPLQDYC